MVVKVAISQELKLDYPCRWQYKAIVESGVDVHSLVVAILDEREFSLRPSKNSAQGKYESHTITVLVHSDDDRKTIFETLKKEEKIKFVL
ncbi:MAG: hypothetical protein PWQ42_371 [Sulfurospirillum sp.]|nr:hypothetical protein [Sulfurospirillum sp.]